jgi:hypothetical protein
MIHVRRQIDLDTGKLTWPKDDDGRWIVMSPALRAHLERMPRMGKSCMRSTERSCSSHHAAAICSGALGTRTGTRYAPPQGCPTKDFYELKHRAIQWVVDPVSDGGLGLDPATVAEMVGHDDGGYLIATAYTKLGQRRALGRAQQAMAAYQERQDAATAETPRLHVVA